MSRPAIASALDPLLGRHSASVTMSNGAQVDFGALSLTAMAGLPRTWRSAASRRQPAVSTGSSSGSVLGSRAFHQPPASVSFAAGLFAGLAVDVPLHPLDTLKTRLQARDGFFACGGFARIWSGLSPVLMRSVPCTALFFVAYEQSRHGLQRALRHPESGYHLSVPEWVIDGTAGAAANVAACTARVPCEVLKQRMQACSLSRAGSGPSLLAVARSVLSAAGWRGFYTGFGATVSRELAFALVQMPLFEELKRWHPSSEQRDGTRQAWVGMTCGGTAGAVAALVTTPLDVAKTQIMLGHRERGVWSTLRSLYADRGARAIFRGALPRTAHVGASCALSFGAFEWAKAALWACP